MRAVACVKKLLKQVQQAIRPESVENNNSSRPATPAGRGDNTPPLHGLLEGKNVLITGAGKNIGRSIALEMARQGARICFTDIDPVRCRNLTRELGELGIESEGFEIDCSDGAEIDRLVSDLRRNRLHIDILVNNIGSTPSRKPFHDLASMDWQTIFGTNVFGPSYLTSQIIQDMLDREAAGSIIFISSIHQETVFGSACYSSSKAALAMIIKELALEVAKYNIRVNGIAPGWVEEDAEQQTLYHKETPLLQSSINPGYIGRGAVYLAADYFSRFTTGTIIKIDAGLSLHNYITML